MKPSMTAVAVVDRVARFAQPPRPMLALADAAKRITHQHTSTATRAPRGAANRGPGEDD
jgi:hypothetical protein